jgi:hypothetical protein
MFLGNLSPENYRLCMKTKPKKHTDYRKYSKKDIKAEEHYRPSQRLVEYLNEKLGLYTLDQQLKVKGKDLPPDKKRQKRANNTARYNVLKTHIFQAMANLIVFFEFIRDNPILQGQFEDEIEELLMGWNKNDKLETPAFARLVNAATFWDYNKDPYNFRLSLLFTMQNAITLKIPIFAKKDFDNDAGPFGISESIVKQDMNRAAAWAGLYARNTLKSENQKEWEDYSRPVLF